MQKFIGVITLLLVGVCMVGAGEPVVEPAEQSVEKTLEKEGTDSMVIIKTSKGDMSVKLFEKEAPLSVKNFLQYVDDQHYNQTIFHRVIEGFMIQGGGFTEDFVQKPTKAPVKNEADNGLKNKRGTLAMARTSVVDSGTSQFFINVVDNAFLDHKAKTSAGYGYCVFGEVVEGLDVVDAIRHVKTGRAHGFSDVPEEAVVILEIIRSE